jgi:sulfur-oxidizing protein SoxA
MRALVSLLVLALALDARAAEVAQPKPLKGGIEFQSADVRALQADTFANPGMLWVARGERLWSQAPAGGPACASCHGDARRSMHGVAARYPKHDAALGRVVDLEGRINACVTANQKSPALAHESETLLSLSAFVALQSAGVPLAPVIDNAARATLERGRRLYFERQGQFNLACNQCHDRNWGATLLAEKISQGHPADWPAYRVEWQSLGSLQRRLRACYFGVRAELPAFGSDDLVALELYLAARARGLAGAPPGVRK